MTYVWAVLTIALMAASQVLHLVGLPANWVLAGLAALWAALHPAGDLGWGFVGLLAGLCLAGEVVEYLAQARGAKQSGASSRGNMGGLVGAVAGAILGAPFLFGLGAIPGAMAGAYGGCLAVERLSGMPWPQASRAAWGAFTGRMLGSLLKMILGAGMFALTVPRLWPG